MRVNNISDMALTLGMNTSNIEQEVRGVRSVLLWVIHDTSMI